MRVKNLNVDVHIHADNDTLNLLKEIKGLLLTQGAKLSELTEAVAEVKASIQEDWNHAQEVIAAQAATIADLGGQLTTALGNDAADAQTIADKQAEVDQLVADANQAVADIKSIDLDPSFPVVADPNQ